MSVVTTSSRGQIVIPKDVRKKLQISPGKRVLIRAEECIFHGNRMSNPRQSGRLFHVKADSEANKKGQIISLDAEG
jgi:AbrB family looped-hinge helix DNA binding protein